MASIGANIKVQAQKLYSAAKSNLIDDGLVERSVKNVIDAKKTQADDLFGDTVLAAKVLESDMDPVKNLKEVQEKMAGTEASVPILNKKDSDVDRTGRISTMERNLKDLTAKNVTSRNYNLKPDDIAKKYTSSLNSTKNAVRMGTPIEMLKEYYMSPFKTAGGNSKGIARLSATAGVGAAGIGVLNHVTGDPTGGKY